MSNPFDTCKDRGNACFRSQDYPSALKWYDQCIEADSTNPVGHSNRAMCLIKLQRGQDARNACQEGLRLLESLPATPELEKIRQKLTYRLQLADQLLPPQHWRDIPIREVSELPETLATL